MNSESEQSAEEFQIPTEMEFDLNQRGIQYTVERIDADRGALTRGSIVTKITSIPAIENAAIGVLSGVDAPPNEEAKAIVDEYNARVEKEQCKGCAKGRLIREYLHPLRVALQGTKLLEYYEKEEERKIKYERFLQEQKERKLRHENLIQEQEAYRLKNEQLRQEQEQKAHHSASVQEGGTGSTEAAVTSGSGQVPGSGAESPARDGKRPSLLRRAARRIAKIYRACTEP